MNTTNAAQAQSLRFERVPAVCQRVGLAQSTLYRWISQGRFPAPIKLGTYAVAWDSRTIDDWMLRTMENVAHDDSPSQTKTVPDRHEHH